ncbi:hypothetical protein GGX14DRAFT_419794 [Mycena pura]|uniref:C2H2-type domain-containing protein n=1 Tax=Mycena pura TaxID=153505 RepID=A0AAD6YS17_9AGAR|nr:hypothetical protein GGX14DRAFT_419794 [Mycena pura]
MTPPALTMTPPASYALDTNRSFPNGDDISITPATPPSNEECEIERDDAGFHTPVSDYGSGYSPSSYTSHDSLYPVSLFYDNRPPPCSPLTPHSPLSPFSHSFERLSLDPLVGNQYAPSNVDNPLSPILPHLPGLDLPHLPGLDFHKQKEPSSVDPFDGFPMLPSPYGTESLLLGAAPGRLPAADGLMSPRYTHSNLVSHQLMPPPRRHSFNASTREIYFATGRRNASDEASSSTPPTPAASFSVETTPDLPPVRPHVASPANLKASSRRRKKIPRFKCELCGSTFTARHNLQNHENSHAGVRPFVCEWCREAFTTKGVLKRHQKTCKACPGKSLPPPFRFG